jgi:3-oxoacyl-[acyl-carrier protein] reductase
VEPVSIRLRSQGGTVSVMDFGLNGRVVFLTGATSSIGVPIARAFAAEGARVVVTYHRDTDGARRVADEVESLGGKAITVPYDLTRPEVITAAVDEVIAAWGGIDVLVLNASTVGGTSVDPVPFEDIPADHWTAGLRADVEGTFHTVQAVLPSMKSRGWGRIVAISANVVVRGAAGDELFVVAKTALHGLSRTLATELAPFGVLSNVVAPGPTVTAGFLRRMPPEILEQIAARPPEEVKRVLNRGKPVGHVSTAEEVANAVVFLGSAANGNISGNALHISGGH